MFLLGGREDPHLNFITSNVQVTVQEERWYNDFSSMFFILKSLIASSSAIFLMVFKLGWSTDGRWCYHASQIFQRKERSAKAHVSWFSLGCRHCVIASKGLAWWRRAHTNGLPNCLAAGQSGHQTSTDKIRPRAVEYVSVPHMESRCMIPIYYILKTQYGDLK
jgi:hypothetical protein